MTFRTLIRRSLRHHWRAHLGVTLGAAIGSAALIGALVVGDSVRGSLRVRVTSRLGQAAFALTSGEHSLSQDRQNLFIGIVDKLDEKGRRVLSPTRPGAALVLPGTAVREDGTARANHVQLIGVDVHRGETVWGGYANGFFGLAAQPSPTEILPGQAHLNQALASQLRVQVGDQLVLRVEKPSALPGDAAVSPRGSRAAIRVRVAAIRSAAQFGDFSLRMTTGPTFNVFLNLSELQSATDLTGRVNTILVPSQFTHANRLEQVLRRLFPNSTVEDLKLVTGVNSPMWGDAIQPVPDAIGFERLQKDTARLLNRLSDADLVLRPSGDGNSFELRSRRVFLDPPVERAALVGGTNAQPILTYLANLLRVGTNATPYSMVTAAGPPWTPADMRDDEILVNQWLADDLRVKPGDEVALSYFDPESGARLVERTNIFRVRSIVPMELPWADRTLMPDFPGIEKAESTRDWDAGFSLAHKIRQKDEDYWKQFRGTPRAFVTLAAGQKMWANRFGNLTAIRFPIPAKFTPRFAMRYGPTGPPPQAGASNSIPTTESSMDSLQADVFRIPAAPEPPPGSKVLAFQLSGPEHRELYRLEVGQNIVANLKPEELGLRFEPVREQALKAAEQSQDFGGLFLGFSFFLIAAALLLMALLFQFGLEQRMAEVGTLLALGFTPRQVRRLLLGEGVALAFIGGVLGALGGLGYAKAMLHGLATVWRDAVGATTLGFHVTPRTLAIGLSVSVIVSVLTIWLTLRKFVRRSPRELLVGDVEGGELPLLTDVAQTSMSAVSQVSKPAGGGNSEALPIGISAMRQVWKPALRGKGTLPHSKLGWLALAGALALVGWVFAKGETANAGAFFGAGALVLVAGLSFVGAWLAWLGGAPNTRSARTGNATTRAERGFGAPITLASLGFRGCARRRKRSLATVAMLACGSFLIISIGVFRLDANRDAAKRTSGTGGFALIGETAMPVVQDLNSKPGREFFALSEADVQGVSFVPFRVREGDEASCLNLNRAQKPRLLGVKPEMLEGLFSSAKGAGWQALKSEIRNSKSEKEIPAIGDANSIQWAMHKKVGDTIDYVDERGQPFKVRIVGSVANSILQGPLIIDEAEFVKRFPGESGYRMFLIDAPSNRVAEVSATLSRALQDVGLEMTPAAQRLAQFNAVQNTYLGTFQVLGGLGLLLGSVGLGIVVLRNVLERRGELAVLLAVGFRKPTLQRLLLIENGALLALGLTVGVIAAAVAVLPALRSPGAELPWLSLGLTLAAVLVNGALWTWAATRFAVRGDLLQALRNE